MARTHSNLFDLTGQKYGRLYVIEFAGYRSVGSRRLRYWKCLCDCGNYKEMSTKALRSNHIKSCGCGIANRGRTHGKSYWPEYRVWAGMKQRCENPKQKSYKNYGARGIKVHQPWSESFESFISDIGRRPSPKHSLERINNDGDYCPENCIWATRDIQNRNSRHNAWLTYNGETLCIKDWALKLGIDISTLRCRLRTWPLEKTMTEPLNIKYSRSKST